ncbi:hypothetical protein ABZW32_14280 [Streptomyces sp. NPDC004667]|uniref:hypothetical protein n=1 Tax=Streptomyces sp. NPDC004667 TaxID=3154285 RepID=UPI00339FA202
MRLQAATSPRTAPRPGRWRKEFRGWWRAPSDLAAADGDGTSTRNEHVTTWVDFVTNDDPDAPVRRILGRPG